MSPLFRSPVSPLFRAVRHAVLLSLTVGLPLSVFATDSRVCVYYNGSAGKKVVLAAANKVGAQLLHDFDDLQTMVVALPEAARATLAWRH